MQIKFWGTRGSIPVPDPRMMRYGGNTTCVEITLGGRTLVIDSGTGIRKLGESLIKRKIHEFDILITHSHWDHIQGFPFFNPIYSPKTRISILGCSNSYRRLKTILAQQMSQEYFPVSFSDLKSNIEFSDTCGDHYEGRGYKLSFIRTNHPVFTLGVRIDEQKSSLVFITDNELESSHVSTPRKDFVSFCKGATYLIHDAQFTDSEYRERAGWGHSTFEQAIALARDANAGNLGFFHHDPNRRDHELSILEKKYRALCKSRNYPFKVFAVKEAGLINIK